MSPCCSSPLYAKPFDFGRCPETGYVDDGETLHCATCGESVDEGDVMTAEISAVLEAV